MSEHPKFTGLGPSQKYKRPHHGVHLHARRHNSDQRAETTVECFAVQQAIRPMTRYSVSPASPATVLERFGVPRSCIKNCYVFVDAPCSDCREQTSGQTDGGWRRNWASGREPARGGGGGGGGASETGGPIGPTAPSIPHAGCSSSRQAAYPPLRSDGENCGRVCDPHAASCSTHMVGLSLGAVISKEPQESGSFAPEMPTNFEGCVNGLGSLVCLEVGLTRWWWHPRRAGSFAKKKGRLAKSPMRLESVTRTKAHAAALIKSATLRSWTHSCWLCRSARLPTSAVLVQGLPCSSIVVGLCICRYSAMLHDGALTRFDECIGSVFASRACTRKATGGDCNFHADATRPQRRAKGQGKIRLAPLLFPQPASALCRRVRRGAQGSPTRLTGPISVASITSAVRDYANGDLVLYRVIGYMADRHVSSEPASPFGPSTWQ